MIEEKTTPTAFFTTLEEIRMRKDQLSNEIESDSEKISTLWSGLFAHKENPTKGEYIASIVTNSITAIDAFLLIRKLMKNYSGIFRFFGKSGKKKRR